MVVAMETGQAGEITTHSNLSTGAPQPCSPGPTLTSRDPASPFMKAHPCGWAAGCLGSVPPLNCQDPEQEVFPIPGPQFLLSKKPSRLPRSSSK